MRFIMNIVAATALAIPAGLAAQDSEGAPSCRANLDGDQLTTAIEFPNGYAVEAPWRVNWNRSASLSDGRTGVAAAAELDRIIEVDPATGQRVVTPFPEPIRTTFEGHDEEELIYQAAQIWCLTVLKAQQQNREEGANRQGASARMPARAAGP
ncbi:MAG TPA: hypothetical protein VF188_13875 [Longimicrobiales bacterium]